MGRLFVAGVAIQSILASARRGDFVLELHEGLSESTPLLDPTDWTVTEVVVVVLLVLGLSALLYCCAVGACCLIWPEYEPPLLGNDPDANRSGDLKFVDHDGEGDGAKKMASRRLSWAGTPMGDPLRSPGKLLKSPFKRSDTAASRLSLPRPERVYRCAATPPEEKDPVVGPWSTFWRRFWFFFFVHVTVAAGTAALAYSLLEGNIYRITVSSAATICFFCLLLTQLAVGLWVSIYGFVLTLCSSDPVAAACPILKRPVVDKLQHTVAIVLPIYNEDVRRVLAGLEATVASLAEACAATQGAVPLQQFEVHVLSDTRPGPTADQENAVFTEYIAFCKKKRRMRVHYRRREKNTNKKVGNIAEFLDRRGSDYDFMVIFDADSIMSGQTLIRMAKLAASNPSLGILQVQAAPIRQSSLFGRMFQFQGCMYGQMMTSGYSWVLLNAGTYIGHNAIIRVGAFRRSGQLPTLPGDPPLGGHILSHDHVEAAVMRKAGWEVWLLPCGEGSYEEIPTNLNDFAARDFRWMTGELQHLKLICMPGLPPLSRYQLTIAATHYLGGTAWLGLTLVGAQAAYHCDKFPLDCIHEGEIDDNFRSMLMLASLALTLLCLFGSRFMMLFLFFVGKKTAPGGFFRCLLSMLIETVITTCLAPLFALVTLWATIKILLGKGSGWDGQDREGRALSWYETTIALFPYVSFAIVVPAAYCILQTWDAAKARAFGRPSHIPRTAPFHLAPIPVV